MDTRLQQLFQVLRWCGAAMIVAAAGTFLIQSWEQVGDVTRYLTLLGMTALLPAVAYVCGIRLQEGRSARVLMLTLLALIPIHAGVLGGFVLSRFGTTTENLAPIAHWVAPSRSAAISVGRRGGVGADPFDLGVISGARASACTPAHRLERRRPRPALGPESQCPRGDAYRGSDSRGRRLVG